MVSQGLSPEWEAEEPIKRTRIVKREQVFLTTVKKSFEQCGGFFYKIPDMPHTPGMRFDTEKPFDAFASWQDRKFAIEGKSLKTYQAFGLRHMRYCQEIGLDSFIESGGESWVFLSIGSDRMIPMNWKWLRKRFKRGSILKAELMELAYIEKIKGRFDLKSWLKTTTK